MGSDSTDETRPLVAALAPGRRLGHYVVGDRLGAGGIGVFHRATDTRLHRDVALKLLPPGADAPDRRAWFEREARVVASLNHPGIVTLHSVEEIEGVSFITMELVAGETLDQWLRHHPLPWDQILDVAVQIADALSAAHARGIAHRDLKPANVMKTGDGRVKILDFGLARVMLRDDVPGIDGVTTGPSPGSDMRLSRPGVVLGTVPYMSPEQARGGRVDGRSDLFSFGSVLYELASARRPFRGETVEDILGAIVGTEPAPLTELRPDAPPGFVRIVRRCLQKRADHRYQDTRDLELDLEEVRGQAGEAPRTRAVASPPTPPTTYRRLTFDGDAAFPEVSPDGQFVAYVRRSESGDLSLMLRDVHGGSATRIHDVADRYHVNIRWSPDGSTILLHGEHRESPTGSLLIPRLGGQARRLPSMTGACWSPDGERIAFVMVSEPKVFVWSRIRGAIVAVHPLDTDRTWADDIDWCPASGRLLVTLYTEGTDSEVWVMTDDGRGRKLELDLPSARSIRWCRDGRSFHALVTRGDAAELWRFPVDDPDPPRRVLGALATLHAVSTSRSGRHLCYGQDAVSSHLWYGTLTPQGVADPRRLTHGARLHVDPQLSPDGRMVAYLAGTHAWTDVHVTSVEDGASRRVTFLDGVASSPVWSPSGDAIAFVLHDGEARRVWTVSIASGAARRFDGTATGGTVAWAPGPDIVYHRLGHRSFGTLDPGDERDGGPLLPEETDRWVFAPCPSPDGSALAFQWNRDGETSLWVHDRRTGRQRRLAGKLRPIGWSASGASVYAFSARPPTIHEIGLESGESRVIATLPAAEVVGDPHVSADGEHVVWATPEITSDIWLVTDFDA